MYKQKVEKTTIKNLYVLFPFGSSISFGVSISFKCTYSSPYVCTVPLPLSMYAFVRDPQTKQITIDTTNDAKVTEEGNKYTVEAEELKGTNIYLDISTIKLESIINLIISIPYSH